MPLAVRIRRSEKCSNQGSKQPAGDPETGPVVQPELSRAARSATPPSAAPFHPPVLRVRPLCNPVRRCQFRHDSVPLQGIAQLRAALGVPLRPGGQTVAGRKPISLLVVASAVGQHEVVGQIYGVSSPGDEMVHVGCGPGDPALAVEPPAPLDVQQRRAHQREVVASVRKYRPSSAGQVTGTFPTTDSWGVCWSDGDS